MDNWELHDPTEDCQDAPATLLCAFDGLLLTVPAACLTVLNERCLKRGQTFVCLYSYSVLSFWGRVEEAGVSHKYQVETRLPPPLNK